MLSAAYLGSLGSSSVIDTTVLAALSEKNIQQCDYSNMPTLDCMHTVQCTFYSPFLALYADDRNEDDSYCSQDNSHRYGHI